jgi:phosphatidylglycerol lysyltransferase
LGRTGPGNRRAINLDKHSRLLRVLPVVVAVGFFTAALFVLHRLLGEFRGADILAQLRAVPAPALATAAGLTAASYFLLTFYDWLALRHLGRPLPFSRSAMTAFVAYAVGHNMGMAALSGGAIRFRMYAAAGLEAVEITTIIGFCTLTFALGSTTLLGLSLVLEADRAGTLLHIGPALSRLAGSALFAGLAGYLSLVALRRRPLSWRGLSVQVPSPPMTAAQLALSFLDLAIASAVLYVLLPEPHGLSFLAFTGLYLVAVTAALVSNVPGGLGVFESVILLLLPGLPADAVLGSLLAYRLLYYALPFVLALLVLVAHEVHLRRAHLGRAAVVARAWLSAVAPTVLATGVFIAGLVLLLSGATPALAPRLAALRQFLPLGVVEASHLAGSAAGVGLMILARGLNRRLDGAWHLAMWLLGIGLLASVLKGLDWEEASLLAAVLLLLWETRQRFDRRTSLLDQSFTAPWTGSLLLALLAAVWLVLFSYRHVEYASELWWQFEFDRSAPRSLRAGLLAVLVAGAFGLTKLLRPAPPPLQLPAESDLERALPLVRDSIDASAHLALVGDKKLLFDPDGTGFVMYRESGRSWVAMGDPVGPPAQHEALAWQFREACDRHDAWTVFYQVPAGSLPLYVDMGLVPSKLGEEAHVRLDDFSLEGSRRAELRQARRRAERDGLRFEVVPPEGVAAHLGRLQAISDAWLASRATAEKGFSVGRFDPAYLSRLPCAMVTLQDRIVAFANLWPGGGHAELSVDLIRHDADAPPGCMDFLFVECMLWGRAQGYRQFSLGMAPLSGLETRSLAPAWHRVGAFLYSHGEHFYNFEGLRNYKAKFDPEWRPRYLVSPGGLALPRVLLDVSALIAGGVKEIVSR